MSLTNVTVAEQAELYGAICVKADYNGERVFAVIPREALDDYFPRRPHLTDAQRRAIVDSNKDAIAATMLRKCEQGALRPVSRWGSTIKQIDFSRDDLFGGARLSDHRLVIEESAGFKPVLR